MKTFKWYKIALCFIPFSFNNSKTNGYLKCKVKSKRPDGISDILCNSFYISPYIYNWFWYKKLFAKFLLDFFFFQITYIRVNASNQFARLDASENPAKSVNADLLILRYMSTKIPFRVHHALIVSRAVRWKTREKNTPRRRRHEREYNFEFPTSTAQLPLQYVATLRVNWVKVA